MCCRCYVEYLKDEELRRIYNLVYDKEDIKTEGEIFPTDNMVVISKAKDNTIGAFKMKWGYKAFKYNIFNARVESLKEKDLFKDGINNKRCVIPISNYFEWQKDTKIKFKIKDIGSVTYLLGIYRFEDRKPVFTIITKDASDEMKVIHDRMPLVISKDEIKSWLYDSKSVDDIILNTKNELICIEA